MIDELGTEIVFFGDAPNIDEWGAILRADPCSYCKRRKPGGTIDHIDPTSSFMKGVPGSRSFKINGTGCCPACNNKKSARKLLTFLRRKRNAQFWRDESRRNSRFFTPEQVEAMKAAAGNE